MCKGCALLLVILFLPVLTFQRDNLEHHYSCRSSFLLLVTERWCLGDTVLFKVRSDCHEDALVTASLYLNDFLLIGKYPLVSINGPGGELRLECDVSVDNVPIGNHTIIAVLYGTVALVKYSTFRIDKCSFGDSYHPTEKYQNNLVLVAPKPAQPYTWINIGQPVEDWANHDSIGTTESPSELIELVQDQWGCVVLGVVVVPDEDASNRQKPGLISIPSQRWNESWERHLYIDGKHSRLPSLERGWVTVHRTPGPLRVDAVVTDDMGDVLFAVTAHIRLAAPPPRSAADPAADTWRLEAALGRAEEVLISCLHPTRGRPLEAMAVRQLWMSRARHPDRIEWIFAVDSDDADTLRQLDRLVREPDNGGPGRTQVVRVPLEATFHAEGTCTGGWNMAAAAAAGAVLAAVADDWEAPAGWDAALLGRTPLDRPAALILSDGVSDACRAVAPDGRAGLTVPHPEAYGPLQSHPVLNRRRYEEQGYVIYPGYVSPCPPHPSHRRPASTPPAALLDLARHYGFTCLSRSRRRDVGLRACVRARACVCVVR
jgi:hypothetical protein